MDSTPVTNGKGGVTILNRPSSPISETSRSIPVETVSPKRILSRPRRDFKSHPVVVPNSKHYKVDALIGMRQSLLRTSPVVLDTGAGPNIVSEDLLPPDSRRESLPLTENIR